MKKTPTIFKRDPANMKALLREQNPEAAWVFAGEGVATRKYDGTCCLIKDGVYYRRREVPLGSAPPKDFVMVDADDTTHKCVGWVPVDPANAENKWHVEAFRVGMPDGTYELLGPKIQGNPEVLAGHVLLSHANAERYADAPRDYDALKAWLADKDIEGLVFHHPDGRMAKIKKRDFGLKRRPSNQE